ncbi:MAG: IS1182 family transposase [Dehalogenimonas sp.]
MLRQKPPQTSFYGTYLYDHIIPDDHLLRKIDQVVDFSFITELVKDRYTPDFGRPAEDPEFMLRLCLLQYLYGDSDRGVIENAKVNLAYKFFLNLSVDDEVPDDTTVSYFRTKRLGEEKFREVFEQLVKQCIGAGLVTGKRQIVDSTHIIADMAVTSLTGLLTLCRRNVIREVARQNQKVAEKLAPQPVVGTKEIKYARMDEGLEQELEAARNLLDGVTEELKGGGLQVTEGLKANLALLVKAVADRDDGATDRLVSPIDPDARQGKKTSKLWAGYKGHVVIEEDSEIITAIETTPGNRNDGPELKGLLKQQEEAYGLVPQEISGDKAYDSGANLEYLGCKGITGNIELARKVNNHYGAELFIVDDFSYDQATNSLTCPAGCTARRRSTANIHTEKIKRNGVIFMFDLEVCKACALKNRCSPSESRGRCVAISYYHPLYLAMKERLTTEEGQESYRKRMRIEHKIADLTLYCGMRRSRYRTLGKAKIHTLLAAIASNVKRMAKILWQPPERAIATGT